jgi:E3 ubiquitin-protein ligase CHFR
MHQAVALMPCLHNYCGGCMSDWIKRSKECPNCRVEVIMVKKNSQLNSTIESYLALNPDLKRSKEDIEQIEKINIFKNDIVRLTKIPIIYSFV